MWVRTCRFFLAWFLFTSPPAFSQTTPVLNLLPNEDGFLLIAAAFCLECNGAIQGTLTVKKMHNGNAISSSQSSQIVIKSGQISEFARLLINVERPAELDAKLEVSKDGVEIGETQLRVFLP